MVGCVYGLAGEGTREGTRKHTRDVVYQSSTIGFFSIRYVCLRYGILEYPDLVDEFSSGQVKGEQVVSRHLLHVIASNSPMFEHS